MQSAYRSLEQSLWDNPGDESLRLSSVFVVLGQTKPLKPLTFDPFPHPIELHCHSCGSLMLDPTTSADGETYCHRCLPSGPPTQNLLLSNLLQLVFPDEYQGLRLCREAEELANAGDPAAALAKFDEAIAKSPKGFRAYFGRAAALLAEKRTEEALRDARQGLRLSSFLQHPQGFLSVAEMLRAQGLLQDSLRYYCAYYYLCSDDASRTRIIDELKKVVTGLAKAKEALDLDKLEVGVHELFSQQQDEFLQALAEEDSKIKQAAEERSDFEEKFQCTLCYGTLYRPLSTPCGHSFCRICLLRSLDHRDSCPLCRGSLSDYLAAHEYHITKALDSFLETYQQAGYLERSSQAKKEEEEFNSVLPVFVCTLALPGLPLPLHVFEPRYRLMMRRCMESGKRVFGMCLYTNNEGMYSEYGTALHIEKFRLLSDGRSYVDTIGTRVFRVLERSVRDGYNVAKVEFLEDDPTPEDRKEEVKTLARELRAKIQSFRTSLAYLPSGYRQFVAGLGEAPEDEAMFSWWAIGALPISEGSKYEFLSVTSLEERLRRAKELCDELEGHLKCSVM